MAAILVAFFINTHGHAQELPSQEPPGPSQNSASGPGSDAEKKADPTAPTTEPSKTPARFDEVAFHRPGLLPDRIVLTWNGDPTTSQSVTWRTDTSIAAGYAEITIAEGGPTFEKKAKRITAATQRLDTDINSAHCHTVHFRDLMPATKYIYRVGDGVNWSEWIQFRTAHAEPEPFSFIYFGDAQNNLRQHWSRVIREAYSDAPKARFMIHTGDLVNNSLRDAEWGEWFQAGGWMNAMVPSLPVIGNHEYVKDPKDAAKPTGPCPHWRAQFALPDASIDRLHETSYAIDYQGVRILCLNSNELLGEQAAWLEKQLADNPHKWTIAAFHHPIFSAAPKRDNAKLRDTWKPLFDKFRIDLVLTGHDHTYARSRPTEVENVATGLNTRSQEAGTVYVVSVSGPKMYHVERKPQMQRVAEDTQLYQIIHIDGDQLRYEARTAAGELYDAFKLVKRPNAINEFVEQVPNTPERLRPPPAPANPPPANPAAANPATNS